MEGYYIAEQNEYIFLRHCFIGDCSTEWATISNETSDEEVCYIEHGYISYWEREHSFKLITKEEFDAAWLKADGITIDANKMQYLMKLATIYV